jgi:hypothetical protein
MSDRRDCSYRIRRYQYCVIIREYTPSSSTYDDDDASVTEKRRVIHSKQRVRRPFKSATV